MSVPSPLVIAAARAIRFASIQDAEVQAEAVVGVVLDEVTTRIEALRKCNIDGQDWDARWMREVLAVLAELRGDA